MAIKMNIPPTDPFIAGIKTGVDYGSHFGTKPIVGAVSKQQVIKGVEQAQEVTATETIHSGVFNTGMAITVEGGRTLNLGNFESARVGVTVTVPCDHATLNDAYEWATNWVSEKIDEAVKAAKGV